MAFDRSKYKAATVSANKEAAQAAAAFTGSSKGSDFFSIQEGVNIFRMLPPHPKDGERGVSIQPLCKTWMEVMVQQKDSEGNLTGQSERLKRPLYNSRMHGGTKKDLIEEYITFVTTHVNAEIKDATEAKRRLAPVYGARVSGKWIPGIRYGVSYAMYVLRDEKVGRLEVFGNIRDRLEELNIDDELGKPLSTDIFSDPNEGVSFIITKSGSDVVVTKRAYSPKHGTYDQWREKERVSDEILEQFEAMPSLMELYTGVYGRSEFEKALEALQYFDTKHSYGVFSQEAWLDIVEEIDGYYTDSNDSEEKVSGIALNPVEVKEEAAEKGVESMTREELKAYIMREELPIVVTSKMSDEQIREAIAELMETTEIANPSTDEKVEVVEKVEEEVKKPAATQPATTTKPHADRLASLRAKLGEKK